MKRKNVAPPCLGEGSKSIGGMSVLVLRGLVRSKINCLAAPASLTFPFAYRTVLQTLPDAAAEPLNSPQSPSGSLDSQPASSRACETGISTNQQRNNFLAGWCRRDERCVSSMTEQLSISGAPSYHGPWTAATDSRPKPPSSAPVLQPLCRLHGIPSALTLWERKPALCRTPPPYTHLQSSTNIPLETTLGFFARDIAILPVLVNECACVLQPSRQLGEEAVSGCDNCSEWTTEGRRPARRVSPTTCADEHSSLVTDARRDGSAVFAQPVLTPMSLARAAWRSV